MVHCCLNSSLASILFAVRKNTFLHFLNVFSKRKYKKLIRTIAANAVTLAPNHGFRGSSLFNIAALSYNEKNKNLRGRDSSSPSFFGATKIFRSFCLSVWVVQCFLLTL